MKNIIRKRFNSLCYPWEKDAKCNEIFLRSQQCYFDDLMRVRKFVFLRDIYMALGLSITKESCILGWVKDVVKDKNYVDFEFFRTKDTDDFELVFECYPILDYLETENVAE